MARHSNAHAFARSRPASPTAALTLANVLYEKKGAIAYVTRQSARRCSTP